MKPRRQKANKAEQERYNRLKQIICICCYDEPLQVPYVGVEIHHMTSGGRRIGNEFTLPLCFWHHRGVLPADSKNSTIATLTYGPSLAKNKRQFVNRYGTEAQLLTKVNNLL